MKYLKLILFFLLLNLVGLDKKVERGFIEWKPISNANGYKVEIRNEKGKLSEFFSDLNIFYPDLDKGNYEFRIAVLNLFRKPVVFSYWNPLKVIQSNLVLLKQKEVNVEKGKKFILIGENFLENTKVTVLKENQKNVLKTNLLSVTKLELMTENLENGIYDIKFENPNQKINQYPKFLKILSTDEIAIHNSSDDDSNSSTSADLIKEKNSEYKKEFSTVINTKDVKINSYSLDKANISMSSEKDKLLVSIGPKTLDKIDINLENKSKEKTIVDIENHSIGEIILNVENKSKEELLMNVDSSSKEKMEINVNESSIGKVNFNLTDKAKKTVKLNNSNQIIDDFDITIENKQTEKLGIQIGDKPIKFTGSDEKFPNNFLILSENEAKSFISTLKRDCPSNLDIPNILIKNCFDDHATLDLEEINKKILYNYLILASDNYSAKMKSLRYFKNYCNPSAKFVSDHLESKLQSNRITSEETIFIKDTLSEFKNCKTLNKP